MGVIIKTYFLYKPLLRAENKDKEHLTLYPKAKDLAPPFSAIKRLRCVIINQNE